MHYNTGRNKSIVKSSCVAMNQIQIISASKRGTRTKHRPDTCSIHLISEHCCTPLRLNTRQKNSLL